MDNDVVKHSHLFFYITYVLQIIMNKLYIFAAIGAGALVLSLAFVMPMAVALPAWTQVDSATKVQDDDTTILTVTTAGAEILRKNPPVDELVNGFGWLNSVSFKGLVAVVHPEFKDSTQNPNSWHLHAVQLGSPDGGNTVCIVEFLDPVTPNEAAKTRTNGGINIDGDTLTVSIATSKLPDDPDVAAGFGVEPNEACGEIGLPLQVIPNQPNGLIAIETN